MCISKLCLTRRMLSDLAIGWLQEEVLLQMYARFAMQPATIPDVVEGWEQPPGSEEAQSRRRRLAASAVSASRERQLRHEHAAGSRTIEAGLGRSRGGDSGDASAGAAVAQSRPDGNKRSGWRYRRRKAVTDKRRAGRALSQSADATGPDAAAGGADADTGWQQASAEQRPHHRRRQRQQEPDSQAAVAQSGSADPTDSFAEEPLYPELPPPMFEQNAGADARRYHRTSRARACCCSNRCIGNVTLALLMATVT